MNYEQAHKRACEIAKRKGQYRHIVLEDGEYHVASDFDLETFFLGSEPVRSISPDGEPILAGDCDY